VDDRTAISPGASGSSGRRRSLTLFILYCVVTGVVLTLFVVRPGMDGHPHAMFTDLVHGRAHKPFVYRLLMPTLIRGISAATPEAAKEAVGRDFERKRLVKALGWESEAIYEYLAAMALMGACFLGTLYAWRRLIARYFRFSAHVADIAPAFGLLAITLFFRYFSYVYDPATLLLFTLAIVALDSGRVGHFYVIFALSVLNKETSLLLIPVFLVHGRWRTAGRTLLAHGGALVILWAAVRLFVMMLFRDNPGGFVEFHLLDHNLRLPWLHPFSTVHSAGIFLAAFWLVRRDWEAKPVFLRLGLLITFIPLLAGSLFFGFVDELRGYYEAYPFLFLLSVPTVCAVFGLSEESGARP
jgi:hypothetical protein